MNPDNILILIILAASVGLFISERLRVDVIALLVLVSLVVTGLVTPAAGFAGFSNPAVVTVWAVFIISGGIVRSGIADRLARFMIRLAGNSERRLLTVIMLTAGIMSAFMNNIGAVAILLPAVVSIAREADIAPSKLLIPLSFAALLGGNLTLIGTPPNILASAILEEYAHVKPFRFFDFTPMGAIALGAGVAYMLLIGRHLLPERSSGGRLKNAYPIREYLTEARISERSPLAGKTVSESGLGKQDDLSLIRIARGDGETLYPALDLRLNTGDTLLIEGPVARLFAATERLGLEMVTQQQFSNLRDLTPDKATIVEVALSNQTRFAGRTLAEIDFRQRYGCTVMGIHHGGESVVDHLGDVRLSFGDSLLVAGPDDKIDLLRQDRNFLLLDMPPVELRRTHKAPQALLILVTTLIMVLTGWLDVATTLVLGAVAMVISGVLTMDEAYGAVDWKSVFLIAGMLPLGTAMSDTGTAALLADQIIGLLGIASPLLVLGGIFTLTALLTEVISNAAATVLIVPIAVDAAAALGADPQPMVMATVLAASTSFLMPIGHQVNVIVFGPGGYKFSDYTRVGVGLNVMMLLLVMFVLPLLWPLFP